MIPKQVTIKVKDKMERVSDGFYGMEKAQIKCLKAPEAEPGWRVWTRWFNLHKFKQLLNRWSSTWGSSRMSIFARIF